VVVTREVLAREDLTPEERALALRAETIAKERSQRLDKELGRDNLTLEEREAVLRVDVELRTTPAHFPTVLRATLITDQQPERASLWTNRSDLRINAPQYPVLATHTAYDAVELGTNVWLCYNCQGVVYLEVISSPGSGAVRERLVLAGSGTELDLVDAWTNAVFSVAETGPPTLTAYGDNGGVLVWTYRSEDWQLDLDRSHPDLARKRASEVWCWVRLNDGKRWSVVRTNPGPKQQLKP